MSILKINILTIHVNVQLKDATADCNSENGNEKDSTADCNTGSTQSHVGQYTDEYVQLKDANADCNAEYVNREDSTAHGNVNIAVAVHAPVDSTLFVRRLLKI